MNHVQIQLGFGFNEINTYIYNFMRVKF